MTEEVVTQEATAQFGQEAENIAHTVHHGQAPQVLFSIKGSRNWKTRNRNSELGTGSGEGQFISLLSVGGLYGVPLEVSITSCLCPGVPPRAARCFSCPVPLPPWSVAVRLPVLAFHDCSSSPNQLCSDTGKPASPLRLGHTFSHSWNRGTEARGGGRKTTETKNPSRNTTQGPRHTHRALLRREPSTLSGADVSHTLSVLHILVPGSSH